MTQFERRKSYKALIPLVIAIFTIAIVLSSVGLKIAYDATNTADRSEDGFCIAIKLIEDGALSDAKIAGSPQIPKDARDARRSQYLGALHFSKELRNLGFRCDPPQKAVIDLERRK